MSVEAHYRPCPDCIDGRHEVCNLEDGCWCNLCWVIVPVKSATPDKAARGMKTRPCELPMDLAKTYGPYDGMKDH